ncbi:MAG: hypothetical protein K2W96_17455 [Gemmataceae bacterium]|nr:hypothetical protein [Gemmataceae bacterium]
MSLLLDLAEETSASDARAADRLEAESRELAWLGQDAEEAQRRRTRAAARQATALALARLPQAEASLAGTLEAFGAKLAPGGDPPLGRRPQAG